MDTFFIKLYILILPVFFGIDLLWLGLIAKGFYAKHLGYIMSPTPNWIAALSFYLLNILGILIFAVLPGFKADSVVKTLLLGAFYGLCTYATYDLTNLATLKNWPIEVTIVDLFWGVFLSTVVSWAGFYIARSIH
jgi:uncharacterized membrane protein